MMSIFMYFMFMNLLIILICKNLLYKFLSNLIFIMSIILIMKVQFMNWNLIYNFLGMDWLSLSMLMLSIWLMGMIFLSMDNLLNYKMFSLIIMILFLSLLLSFSSMNYFIFYMFFEISLIPTFLIIMGWGYQPERINASMFMLLYTMIASLPLMIILFYLFKYYYSMNYLFMLMNFYNIKMNYFIFYFYMIFAFLVKIPMLFFHFWLPKAHIEAPVIGSMILAGIMLKLGGYGLIRSLMMMLNLSMKYNYIFMVINLMSITLISLMCLSFMDMKLIIAYSSIVHMSLMMMGVFSMMNLGMKSAILLMIGHGLCSSAMFYISNLFYKKSLSRNLLINKGMILFFPSLILWWLIFCVMNMSFPFSLNFLSEMMLMMMIFSWSFKILFILMLGIYISTIYSIILFMLSSMGKNTQIKYFNNIKLNEYLVCLIHYIPLNLLFLKMNLLI